MGSELQKLVFRAELRGATAVLASLLAIACGGNAAPTSPADDEKSEAANSNADSMGKDSSPKSDTGNQGADPGDGDSQDTEEDPGDEPEDPSSAEGFPKFDIGGGTDEPDKKGDKDDCECQERADRIYLWGRDQSIWRFDPSEDEADAFENLGKPDCAIPVGQHPFSMGVDRHANAWLTIRSSGRMFKFFANDKDKRCEETKHKPGTEGFTLFGMAFVEHPRDGRCEQLYMHSFDGETPSEGSGAGTLGVLDPETFAVKKVSPIDFNGGELTGTADGRLFAFAGTPSRLLEYDPKTGKVKKEIPLGDLELSSSFAFAFWGGDFYFFTENLGTFPFVSKVTKLDYTGDGSLTTFIEKAPLRVAGAGVSICAPLIEPPPK